MHTPETIIAIYALNYIGAIANMVYMTLAENEIVETVRNTNSKLLLTLDVALDRINNLRNMLNIPIIVLGVSNSMPAFMKAAYRMKAKPKKHTFLTWKAFCEKSKSEDAAMSDDETAPSVIVYTSGTTGDPKGVVLSGCRLNAVANQLKRSYGDKKTAGICLNGFTTIYCVWN